MDYEFLDSSVDRENVALPLSHKINSFLLKNDQNDVLKAIDFIASKEKFLYVHGFLGTGKRQFINYLCDFLSRDVIKLEYYCKAATVCDDILLVFNEIIEQSSMAKAVNLNAKITTLGVKFAQQISSIKKPFVIILHSYDDVQDENKELIAKTFESILQEENVKLIISTRAMMQNLLGNREEDRKIFLKAFNKEVFQEFLLSNNIHASDNTVDDFYRYTRGYYYYTALAIKIVQARKTDLNEFLTRFAQSGMLFDSYLGATYVNLIPTAIRNFFWFLRTIRHGLTLNALAVFDIYDEFSVEFLKTNLMIFQSGETVYVQDYFLQNIDISIPAKTEIKLHKYIVSIYEKQLKESLKDRAIMISRQAMRAEIEYHNQCVYDLEHGLQEKKQKEQEAQHPEEAVKQTSDDVSVTSMQERAKNLVADKKYTDAIELYTRILDLENLDLQAVVDTRVALARLYKEIADYRMSSHYYELAETYYKQHKELINLNYLYYEMTDLYFKMYKNSRAVETIKKVIYSVDTPQSLMVSACTLLGNIYSEMNNPKEAYSYYKKALESLDDNVEADVLAELYFKFALANDDRGELNQAFEYYNKCIACGHSNPYKASAYSNLGSCYYENESYDDALSCFEKAYEIEENNNNYEGIYYNASYIAKIYAKRGSKKALEYLMEAQKSAEFINEEFYIMQSAIALGDYYYSRPDKYKDCLKQYFIARRLAATSSENVDISKIESRIADMKLRMTPEDFRQVERRYGKQN